VLVQQVHKSAAETIEVFLFPVENVKERRENIDAGEYSSLLFKS
jgi:hypothetical protein